MDELNSLKFGNMNNIYIYLERHKKAFKGNIEIIKSFLSQQEPWEETDIIFFDDAYCWFVAVTHEDEIILFES